MTSILSTAAWQDAWEDPGPDRVPLLALLRPLPRSQRTPARENIRRVAAKLAAAGRPLAGVDDVDS